MSDDVNLNANEICNNSENGSCEFGSEYDSATEKLEEDQIRFINLLKQTNPNDLTLTNGQLTGKKVAFSKSGSDEYNEEKSDLIDISTPELYKSTKDNIWFNKILENEDIWVDPMSLSNDDSEVDNYLNRIDYIDNYCDNSTDTFEYEKFFIDLEVWRSIHMHQRESLKWLLSLYLKESGGVLADKYGSGKTATCCVFLGCILQYNPTINAPFLKDPTLVLCSSSTMNNWLRELHTWTPGIKVISLHETRSNKSKSVEQLLLESYNTTNVILITYETLQSISETSIFHLYKWGCVFLDEVFELCDFELLFRLNTVFKLVLTDNIHSMDLNRLWHLVEFALPGRLGHLNDFKMHFIDKFSEDCYYHILQALRRNVQDFIRVSDAYSFPCSSRDFFIHLSSEQNADYKSFISDTKGGDDLEKIKTLLDICNYSLSRKSSSKIDLLNKFLSVIDTTLEKIVLFVASERMLELVITLVNTLQKTYFVIKDFNSSDKVIQDFNDGNLCSICILTPFEEFHLIRLYGIKRLVVVDPLNFDITRLKGVIVTEDCSYTLYRMLTIGTVEEKIYKYNVYQNTLTTDLLSNPNVKVNDFFVVSGIDGEDDMEKLVVPEVLSTNRNFIFEDIPDDMSSKINGKSGREMAYQAEKALKISTKVNHTKRGHLPSSHFIVREREKMVKNSQTKRDILHCFYENGGTMKTEQIFDHFKGIISDLCFKKALCECSRFDPHSCTWSLI